MAIITDLPNETLAEFLSLLSSADLASTSLISHRFHAVSQPLLYRDPCLAITPPTLPMAPGSALGDFLRTLLTPGLEYLGSHVRSLSVTLNDDCSPTPYDPSAMSLINAIATRLTIPNPLNSQGPHLMILLDLLPRLHTLNLSPPNVRVFECAVLLPRGLQSLHTLHYTGTDNLNFVKAKRIILPLALPLIRRITLPTVVGHFMPRSRLMAAAGTSPLTHLRYSHAEVWSYRHPRYSDIAAKALVRVLCIPRALTHFEYTAVSDTNRPLPAFMKTIAILRSTLRNLKLDFAGEPPFEDEEFELPFPEGSLRDWPVLQVLRCSLVPLLGRGVTEESARLVDVLPPGLRELEVLRDWRWGEDEAVRQVVEVLGKKKDAVPGLVKVAVFGAGGSGGEGGVQELVRACDRAGVCFVQELAGW